MFYRSFIQPLDLEHIVYGFSSVGQVEAGFLSPKCVYLYSYWSVGIVLFSLRQFKLEDPVMDLRVFKYPMFTHGILMFVIIIMTMFSSEIILPIFMQGPMALTAATAGLLLLPGSILNGMMSPFNGTSI